MAFSHNGIGVQILILLMITITFFGNFGLGKMSRENLLYYKHIGEFHCFKHGASIQYGNTPRQVANYDALTWRGPHL